MANPRPPIVDALAVWLVLFLLVGFTAGFEWAFGATFIGLIALQLYINRRH